MLSAYKGSFSVSASGTGDYSDCSASFKIDISIPENSNTMTYKITNTSYVNAPKMQVELYYKHITDSAFGGSFYNTGYKSSGTFPCISGGSYTGTYTVDAEDFDLAVNLFISNTSSPNGTSYLKVDRSIKTYALDIGTYIDGVKSNNGGGVTYDVYINNVIKANDVVDWASNIEHGSTYLITDIKPLAGYKYNGVYSGSLSGTMSAATNVYLNILSRTYLLKYEANGGTGIIEEQTVKWHEQFIIAENQFERNGYNFLGFCVYRNDDYYYTDNGWQTEEDIVANGYSKIIYNEKETYSITSDWCNGNSDDVVFTFYAVWQPNTYIITLDGNGGTTSIDSLEIIYETDKNNDIGQYIPTRQAYKFLGFYTDDGVQIYDENGSCTDEGTYWFNGICVYAGDYTLYAQWEVLNIAYYKHEGEWKLYRTYNKVNNMWKPVIMYIKSNNKYIR